MQRCRTLQWCMCIFLIPACIRTQFIASTTPRSFTKLEVIAPKGASRPTYFFMDPNGSYKYAFDTGSGIASEQSANQANEVTGQYSYYENGIPYMVKYKAGIQGYQAEIIPGSSTAAPQTNKNAAFPIAHRFDGSISSSLPTARSPSSSSSSSSPLPILSETSHLSVRSTLPHGGNSDSSSAATLQFVQDMVRTMRSQPIQLSFSSQQAHLQHGLSLPINAAGSRISSSSSNTRSATTRKTNFPAFNTLASLQSIAVPTTTVATFKTHVEQLRQPYAFSYSSEQSARSESADQSGNVVGKYSYYDEAGFHELNYKAGDGIGFVVLGGNLAAQKAAAAAAAATAAINIVPQPPNPNYGYSILPAVEGTNSASVVRRSHNAETVQNRNTFEQNGRSLRKFRRHVKW